MTDLLAQLTAWCKEQRVLLKRQLDMLEAGQMFTFETRGEETKVDTTAETVLRVATQISQLNKLLAEDDEAQTEAMAKGQLPSAI